MSQLSFDCLMDIFDYLENDKISLFSCLLVNKLWCNISVRILWKDSSNYSPQTFRTLIICLLNESKEDISKNKNNLSSPIPKPPMFNYASFCKILSVHEIQSKFKLFVRSPEQYTKSHNILIGIFKLFMRQISSLKQLDISPYDDLPIVIFTSFPGAENCLKNITELRFFSFINSEFFYHLTQFCHNIQSLTIEFCDNIISNGLKEFLFSIQNNLKYFNIIQSNKSPDLTELVSSFTPILYNTVYEFHLNIENVSFSFINNFTNLQELEIELYDGSEVFEKLVSFIFPNLKILKIDAFSVNVGLAIKFLENNGKNLKELTFCEISGVSDNCINLAIAKFCNNLKKLCTGFRNDELEIMKIVLCSCKYLETIKIWLGDVDLLNEKVALEMIANYSPKNLNKIELLYCHQSYDMKRLLPVELDSFFISWAKRVTYLPITIFIKRLHITKSLDTYDENLNIIEKYIRLKVIKKFIISVEPDGGYIELLP
ncbi:hypothetical protein RclHR1_18080003 [Rhizophagus clarus]|uniref:F-box domain-containing protein n=1 Tax=Rhizophagus clarus TaxID=94130 RepID=A0A2Z6QLB9_9GLOM|nr:hypothetical protein RclHR1_18080003 [Rhizophagus clarus]GES79579.1 hypothetical protein GLOIN_2v1784405 [Rhizophagus clarus]